jgi:hypothetical protein
MCPEPHIALASTASLNLFSRNSRPGRLAQGRPGCSHSCHSTIASNSNCTFNREWTPQWRLYLILKMSDLTIIVVSALVEYHVHSIQLPWSVHLEALIEATLEQAGAQVRESHHLVHLSLHVVLHHRCQLLWEHFQVEVLHLHHFGYYRFIPWKYLLVISCSVKYPKPKSTLMMAITISSPIRNRGTMVSTSCDRRDARLFFLHIYLF